MPDSAQQRKTDLLNAPAHARFQRMVSTLASALLIILGHLRRRSPRFKLCADIPFGQEGRRVMRGKTHTTQLPQPWTVRASF
jgi:hypothetical protein